jgi:hypothetical protein
VYLKDILETVAGFSLSNHIRAVAGLWLDRKREAELGYWQTGSGGGGGGAGGESRRKEGKRRREANMESYEQEEDPVPTWF